MMGGGSAVTVEIEMPQLSSDDEGATLAAWLVSVGDRVEKGDVIAELETDKSTLELESPATGIIAEFVVPEGVEGIMPGTILAKLDADDVAAAGDVPAIEDSSATSENLQEPGSTSVDTDAAAKVELSVHPGNADPVNTDLSADESELRGSTPLARRAAVDRDVDLKMLSGSGPGGRVLEEDVLRSADREPVAGAVDSATASNDAGMLAADLEGSFTTVRLTAMRKTIARRMTEAKQQVPHFYLRSRCSMDAVVEIRAKLNHDLATVGRDLKISVNDFIVRAAGLALRDVPEANVSFAGEAMHLFEHVDIAVAVATDGGLVTPVIRDADQKGLSTLAVEVRELASQARAGKLRPEQYQGGSFTISNLGMYGIESVYPILNPPQACILGVGAAEEQPVVRNGEIVIGRVASITLAADHRAVDGAIAARLLVALRDRLEDPLSMML
jgi:pyruvate dehydrogenase E2 component (dihydrolipoamide acetyltransferase)